MTIPSVWQTINMKKHSSEWQFTFTSRRQVTP